MLCHQMTAAHFSAMRLLAHSARPDLPPAEVTRRSNAAARQMDVYQAACLTLQQLKTHGTQRVIVQHQQLVNVGQAGQAVVGGPFVRGLARPAKAWTCGWLKHGLGAKQRFSAVGTKKLFGPDLTQRLSGGPCPLIMKA
jgi:hypothetical protein